MRDQTGGNRMSGRTGSDGANFLLRLLLGWLALASGLVWSAAADAQLLPYRNDIAPDRQVIESRGVDVNLGDINVSTEPVGVGGGRTSVGKGKRGADRVTLGGGG